MAEFRSLGQVSQNLSESPLLRNVDSSSAFIQFGPACDSPSSGHKMQSGIGHCQAALRHSWPRVALSAFQCVSKSEMWPLRWVFHPALDACFPDIGCLNDSLTFPTVRACRAACRPGQPHSGHTTTRIFGSLWRCVLGGGVRALRALPRQRVRPSSRHYSSGH